MNELTITQRLILTVYIILMILLVLVGIHFSTKPSTCDELNIKLTAYEWYMKNRTLEYEQWLEFTKLSYEWSDLGCERETSEGDTESPSTGRNDRTASNGEWSVLERRKVLLSATTSAEQESVPQS